MNGHGSTGHVREIRWLLAVIVVGVLLRVAAIALLNVPPESDEIEYRTMARNMVSGMGIVDSTENYAMYNVGYPLFILAPVMAVFGDSLLATRCVNALLGLVSVFLCSAIAREVGAGRVGRLAAAAMWACYLPSSVYAVYLAKENLMTPLMLGVMWAVLRLANRDALMSAFASGLGFGALALTGSAALSLGLPAATALVWSRAPHLRKLSAAVIIVATAAAVAAPWVVRNQRVLGGAVLNTNGGFNLYLGNNPAATGYFMSIRDTPLGPTWHALRERGELQASLTLRREALRWIMENPGSFVALALRKAVLFWTPPVHEGTRQVSMAERSVRLLWLVQFVLLVAGALGGVLFPSGRTRAAALVWLAVGAYTAVHMLFYVIFRYREPIMPLVCVLAALALEGVWGRFAAQSLSRRPTAS